MSINNNGKLYITTYRHSDGNLYSGFSKNLSESISFCWGLVEASNGNE